MSLFGNKTKTEEKKKPAAKTVAKAPVKAEAKKPSMKDLYKEEGAKTQTKAKAEAVKEDSAKTEVKEVAKKVVQGAAYHVLVKPLVTEKGSILGTSNKYVFMVDKRANKIEVANAVEAAYGIKPTKVNIINIEGKTKRRGKVVGKRKDWKKAIVTLPEGKTIQIYEGI